MSLRLQMLQVARLAPKLLGDSTDFVRRFFVSQQNSDGGFNDRSGDSDLYYTVFALEGILALSPDISPPGAPPVFPSGHPLHSSTQSFLTRFRAIDSLDFVHACCLARAWASLVDSSELAPDLRGRITGKLEAHRTPDGGYHPLRDQSNGTAYGCFLALGAYQDLGEVLPNPDGLLRSLKLLQTEDGAWANERSMTTGSTNATAAAITVLRSFSIPLPATAGQWLLQQAHSQGGFVAAPNVPMPDLLSTATALHALAGLQLNFDSIKETCLDFINTLWTNQGGFHGHWTDDHLDAEYTYYGLLALGHLSV